MPNSPDNVLPQSESCALAASASSITVAYTSYFRDARLELARQAVSNSLRRDPRKQGPTGG
jgi:hypothetical protein